MVAVMVQPPAARRPGRGRGSRQAAGTVGRQSQEQRRRPRPPAAPPAGTGQPPVPGACRDLTAHCRLPTAIPPPMVTTESNRETAVSACLGCGPARRTPSGGRHARLVVAGVDSCQVLGSGPRPGQHRHQVAAVHPGYPGHGERRAHVRNDSQELIRRQRRGDPRAQGCGARRAGPCATSGKESRAHAPPEAVWRWRPVRS